MCGINGHLSFNNNPDISLVQKMNNILEHRGPDANAVWYDERIALGHTRLSIIDLSEKSNQPFVKNNFVIVFNGEIYNYKELKSSQLKEVEFITDSDTEVVLELWKKFGLSCLEMLRGMFAFTIYDKASMETYIVRDHFGIKPLFYVLNNNECFFSSELKALEVFDNEIKSLNIESVAASMLYCWIPEKLTAYNVAKKLQPGEVLHLNSQGFVSLSKYWCNSNLIKKNSSLRNEKIAKDTLSNVLEDSVKKHLVSDVPVNAFLSGGLDSSLLVSMAKKHIEDIECYTIKFSEADQSHESMVDDSYYASKVANELDVKLNTIEIKPDLASLLPKIVHHLDEPIGDSAAINTFLICDAAKNAGVKVLLSGMGADEIFAGYRRHLANKYARFYRKTPSFARNALEASFIKLPVRTSTSGNKIIRWAKRFFSFASLTDADAYLRSYTYYGLDELMNAFEEPFCPNTSLICKEYYSDFNEGFNKRGLVDGMCFTDLNHFMVSLNLTYTDRSSMAASTEVRVPFIDKEVIKTAFEIDQSLKLKGSTQKYILKRVAEDWLSHEIIYRPKASFTMPLRAWIKNDLNDLVSDYLLSSDGLSGRKIIKPSFINKIITDEIQGNADNAQKIWHLLTLEQWLRNKNL